MALVVAAAAYVALLPGAVPLIGAVVVGLCLQLAYAVDCADGQLARLRQSATAFGCWLDHVCDSISFLWLLAALCIFGVKALAPPASVASLFTALVVGSRLIQFFSGQYRTVVISDQPALTRPSGRLHGPVSLLITVTDHGVFLAIIPIGLLFPRFLVATLISYSALWTGKTLGQLAMLGRRARPISTIPHPAAGGKVDAA